WLLAQIEKTKNIKAGGGIYRTSHESDEEIIRWYDREDHLNFDVCADDHCQRYQGISKILTEKAVQAVDDTRGEVLTSNGNVCDARFSKCCGGISENFENVWEPVRHSYLTKVVDSEFGDTTCVDLRRNVEAEVWIRTFPYAFCNTTDKEVLAQVLPDFDQATVDFYRWTKTYSQKELAALIKKRSGIDFGEIVKLEGLERGHSGRLIKLKIHGTKRTLTVGKELEIRKWLSESHLYSSAFVVDHFEIRDGIPQKIVLTGAGWGHGVGLCQIGAAVMGEKGYSYKQILSHYFQGAELKKIYKT
ncbi:MAG: SpoIID/LytB domain-containing protein, partial [Mariniphaga sp.]